MNCRPALSLLLFVAVSPLLNSAASPQAATASIEGIVVKIGAADVQLRFQDKDGRADERAVTVGGGTPIDGATVELTGIAGTEVRSYVTRTGRDGKFVLRNIPPGQGYQLIVIRSPEYLPAQYAQPAPGLPGMPLTLSSGQRLSSIRIALWPAAQVSGRVLDRKGKPVKAIVTAFKPWYLETWRVLGQTTEQSKTGVVSKVETNDRGEYRFQGLPAGQYYFHASSISSIQIDDVRGYTISSYYGASGPAADEADPVNLDLGETVSGLNIVSEPMLRNTILGQAVDRRTGTLFRPTQTFMVRRGDIPEVLTDSATRPAAYPGRTGFVLSLYPGSYVLTVLARGASGSIHVNVGNSNMANLRVPLSPLTEIDGRVTIDGNPGGVFAANGAPVKVILRSLTAPIPNIIARVRPDGSFQLREIPAGDYRVDIHPFLSAPPEENVPREFSDMYVRSLRFGKEDVLGNGLRIEGGSTSRMDVVVGTNGGVVAGRVLRDKQTSVVNARAVLVPNVARRGDLYKSAFTDDNGQFEIRGVPPGEYKLFAWELVEFGAWQDPHFMKLYENRGTSVRMNAGGRQSVDAILIPALEIKDSK